MINLRKILTGITILGLVGTGSVYAYQKGYSTFTPDAKTYRESGTCDYTIEEEKCDEKGCFIEYGNIKIPNCLNGHVKDSTTDTPSRIIKSNK